MSAFRVLLRALARREQRQQQQQLLFSSSFTSSSTLLSRTLLLGGGGGGGGTPGVAVTKKKAALSTFSRVSSSSLLFFFFFEQQLRRGKGRAQKKIDKQNALPRETERVSRTRRGRRGVGREKLERENDERFVFDSIRKSFGRGKSRFVLVFDWTKRSAEIFKRGKRGV